MKKCPCCNSNIVDKFEVGFQCSGCSFPRWSGEVRIPIDENVDVVGLYSAHDGLVRVWIDDQNWPVELSLEGLADIKNASYLINEMVDKLNLKRSEFFLMNSQRLENLPEEM